MTDHFDAFRSKGFITIATGEERYYQLAVNLLHSYRLYASDPAPFCLLCDRENKFSAEFDDVVILDKAYNSYLDKLQIYRYAPYDETIFIDADSLAYADLNKWWDIFSKETDFSAFGIQREIDSGEGFFDPNQIGEYGNQISYIPDFTAGVYYMRRSNTCKKLFEMANEFAAHYFEYGFKRFVYKPADEPVIALAMAIMQCKCTRNLYDYESKNAHICSMPHDHDLKSDILKPIVQFRFGEDWYSGEVIHWGNQRTLRSKYRLEVRKMDSLLAGNLNGSIKTRLLSSKVNEYFYRVQDLRLLPKRVLSKIKYRKTEDGRSTSKLF